MRIFRIKSKRPDEGAAMVEFALILPFLLLILFGIIEFGWALSTTLDIRHGAREGARLAAVNADSAIVMGNTVCDSMSLAGGATVIFANPGDVGDEATVTVEMDPYDSLTGFLDILLPGSLGTTVTIRIEQDSTWAADTGNCP